MKTAQKKQTMASLNINAAFVPRALKPALPLVVTYLKLIPVRVMPTITRKVSENYVHSSESSINKPCNCTTRTEA